RRALLELVHRHHRFWRNGGEARVERRGEFRRAVGRGRVDDELTVVGGGRFGAHVVVEAWRTSAGERPDGAYALRAPHLGDDTLHDRVGGLEASTLGHPHVDDELRTLGSGEEALWREGEHDDADGE